MCTAFVMSHSRCQVDVVDSVYAVFYIRKYTVHILHEVCSIGPHAKCVKCRHFPLTAYS